MTKKYYAVRIGHKPGIYKSWPEAQKQIHGFSGAIFKSFKSIEEANNFIGETPATKNKKDSSVSAFNESIDTIEAYVDGSFDKKTNKYSSGIVLLQKDTVLDTFSRVGAKPEYQQSWQIAGEVFGAIEAIKWAISKAYKKIIIYYDYIGIEHWAKKDWQAKQPVSKDYIAAFDQLKNEIDIEFIKVKAHSGIKFNELADQLAKDALINNK